MPEPAGGAFGEALRVLLDALSIRRKRQLGLLTLLTVVGGAADLVMVAAGMIFLAALASQPVTNLPAPLSHWLMGLPSDRQVSAAAALFAASALIANLFRWLNLRLGERYVWQVAHELTVEAQRRVIAQPYEYHVRHSSSELLASLDTVQLLAFNLVHQWLQTTAALATGLAVASVLIAVDPLTALGAFAVLVLFYVAVARLAARRLAANSDIIGQAFGDRISKVQESLGAIRDLKIDHSEHSQIADFDAADARYAHAGASTAVIAGSPRYVIEAGAALLIAAIAVLLAGRGSGSALVLIGGIGIGGLRALPLLQQAYRSWAMNAANRAIAGQVGTLLALPLPEETGQPAAALPFTAAVELEGIRFAYPDRAQPAVEDVCLTIERGSRVGLAGETGSGKSTLVDLVMGLLSPQAGSVTVDGTRLTAATMRAWQRNIAHVSQRCFLVDASIARNIAFSVPGEQPDMARVRRAAEHAAIADFIESLPDGFETAVGERGVRLSGGQRQRIAIARALYKDAPFLVLDEATNELDEETEAKVLANLFADRSKSILIIAHRPSALKNCDEIVRMAGGRIIAG